MGKEVEWKRCCCQHAAPKGGFCLMLAKDPMPLSHHRLKGVEHYWALLNADQLFVFVCSVAKSCPTFCDHELWHACFPLLHSWNLLKLRSIESVIPSNHLILCLPLLSPSSSYWALSKYRPGTTRPSLVAQLIKNPPAMWETPVWFLGREDPLEGTGYPF